MKKLGHCRAVAVLLTSVLVAALALTLVVVQTRAATLRAPASTEQRTYDDGVYTVRLGDIVGAELGHFDVWLSGPQAAELVTTPGVLSVTRLAGRAAAAVQMPPGCRSATASAAPAPAAPAPVPSPSPLAAAIPSAAGGVGFPGGDHATRALSGLPTVPLPGPGPPVRAGPGSWPTGPRWRSSPMPATRDWAPRPAAGW